MKQPRTLPSAQHVSAATRAANPGLFRTTHEDHARNQVSGPVPQRAIRDDALAALGGKEANAGRIQVRIVSFRKRLIDPDNLCGKFFLDACRYGGLIPDDTAEDIEFSIAQTKVKTREEERTEIIIETP